MVVLLEKAVLEVLMVSSSNLGGKVMGVGSSGTVSSGSDVKRESRPRGEGVWVVGEDEIGGVLEGERNRLKAEVVLRRATGC